MLKVLRVSSFVIMILVLFATITIIVFGLKDNPQVQAFLQRPGILERVSGSGISIEPPKDTVPPLVAQARAFALRIDRPILIDTSTRTSVNENDTSDRGGKTIQSDETSDGNPITSFKFDLLATVRYISAPEKSLALFKSGGRQEWFYKGQTVGRHKIEDIKDGRVTLAQPGQNPEEIHVPPQPDGTALLK